MDYSNQYHQYPGAQPYGHFMPVPPLTPSHSHSATSDDFNASPPQDAFDAIHANGQFQSFDYPQTFNAPPQATAFSGPPTPPTNGLFGTQQQQQQFHNLQQQQQQKNQVRSPLSSGASNDANDSMTKMEQFGEENNARPGGSDDDDMMNNDNSAPAQSKRKAQNRAAQRAFRERKEKHVKDLEVKLADLESAQQQSSLENQRLKNDLQKISTENEILRATGGGPHNSHSPEPISAGPMTYQPVDFYSSLLKGHNNQTLSHRIAFSDQGERLLGAAATWDFIVNHHLYKSGRVNIGQISENLNHLAKCDGQGPVFAESTIIEAIELSAATGSDDLL